jgi:hypothetical protein
VAIPETGTKNGPNVVTKEGWTAVISKRKESAKLNASTDNGSTPTHTCDVTGTDVDMKMHLYIVHPCTDWY